MSIQRILTTAVACLAVVPITRAEDTQQKEAEQATIVIGGAHCAQCAAAIEKAMRSAPGFEIEKKRLEPGEKPNFFSNPLIVSIVGGEEAYLGQLAELVAKVKLPHRDKVQASVNVALHTTDRIDEELVQRLREHLKEVNGLVVDRPGSLGGIPTKGLLWIRMEKAGGAELAEIREAVRTFSGNAHLVEED